MKKIGNIFRIKIDDGIHCYARQIEFLLFEFFDCFTKDDLTSKEIIKLPIFIRRRLYKNVFSQSSWKVIGNEMPNNEYLDKIFFFRQDLFDLDKCWLIDIKGFVLKEISPNECIGLEREVINDYTTIEEVLNDRFNNRVNQNEQLLKLKL